MSQNPIPGSAPDPLWYKDAIVYELHVRAFFDSNNDGIGDFPGLMRKLDYLQALGVTCIWLLPFYPSPLRDDGYDIADYRGVHPNYGTVEDIRLFIQAAHERGLQVITELVVNHTSDQHPWFQRARLAPAGSVERNYYVWSDTDQLYRDARIIFLDSEKSNWTWDPVVKQYYWHRFFAHQPDLNMENPEVIREVIATMDFWLEMGVDGLRLDAIPYLVERDGTNCENLPETHEIIRQFRRAMDARYANRMFLAEANQWPADVRAYFGESDQCHMAYHFPLMPRMYMAIHLEDRHPITEIMAQTPSIPESCQWALFLRNHDELTLEMVTDEERDYMYLAYSRDPRARINLGIRRRLAPLLGNDRRRMELMNSLLFSFPGTPVLYYGDEIGMGDNIYLGDRNGVRTPMQWSADRNGGFSRANPARLYSPPIMDPIYGYEAINVEAQEESPASLLQWMRNMIALRKLFKVFGRGGMEFLLPANRKVLAYARRYENDLVLCVANLSRFSQPVELDLREFSGMTPVEMLGYTEFPRIGEAPYLLTLAPYGFYWFELQRPVVVEPDLETRGVEVFVDGSWDIETLERDILPAYLPGQRWFGAKSRAIAEVKLLDSGAINAGTLAAFAQVRYQDGGEQIYFLLLAHDGRGGFSDEAVSDDTCRLLLDTIAHQGELRLGHGVLRGTCTAGFSELRGPDAILPIQRGSAEQSNTSLIFDARLIMKLFRRAEAGPNPDYEISRYLAEHSRFENVPRLAGAIEYQPTGQGEPTTVALLQQLVPNQGDGWKNALDELGRYFEHCAALRRGQEPPRIAVSPVQAARQPLADAVRNLIGLYLEKAATLGRRTAQMHLALAQPTSDPAFQPERITREVLHRLAGALKQHAVSSLDQLRQQLAALPEESLESAGAVLGRRQRLLSRFDALADLADTGLAARVHGDYHLGQVLTTANDFVIIDFEGEPARPLAERRSKQSPLKDVAGMLRSFSYASYAALFNFTARRPEDFSCLESWARLWERGVSAAFLSAYRGIMNGMELLPASDSSFAALLEIFLLDKALYELSYELNNRPAWLRIPLAGLLALG
ncbi:MAG: maltose alpha-D-glucosyltransferase [Bryobacterales bacterium]|nr:maltose alpha-D-glucosyltransferase [Bryobacterales bacterium]